MGDMGIGKSKRAPAIGESRQVNFIATSIWMGDQSRDVADAVDWKIISRKYFKYI